jgi:hypothetical protein
MIGPVTGLGGLLQIAKLGIRSSIIPILV